MKTLLMSMALVGMLITMAGCETLADTPAENSVRLQHAALINLKAFNNDWQYVLYLERPTWLSRYPIPND